ncbi:MAG: hypothetical protein EAX89_17235 [Candidatus Lokiarchaeota archaeon]|nr:hypothetical protein [Candidatus Lokiarchaeota archaeon]
MAQILLKNQASKAEEKEKEFVIISPAEFQIQIPKLEGSIPQARDIKQKNENSKKSFSKLFKNRKYEPKYLEEVVRMTRYKINVDNQALFVRKFMV